MPANHAPFVWCPHRKRESAQRYPSPQSECGVYECAMDESEHRADWHEPVAVMRRKFADAGAFSIYAVNRFNSDGCFAASGALSYTTLVSLVPLGVIAFGILSVFPNFADLRQRLLALFFRNFVPAV